MSGRELLTFNPELFMIEDDDVMDVEELRKDTSGVDAREEKKDEGHYNPEEKETDTNASKEEKAEAIDESLFKEEDLPEDSEE